jgi:dihydroorotate dehydrogenase
MLYSLLRPLLFRLDAERAHELTLQLLSLAQRSGLGLLVFPHVPARPRHLMGLAFPNPVGLAAGLDKNGHYLDALAALGFGFIEIGTVTPRPQPGNPQPRLYRVEQARAIINRMGFNNLGVEHLMRNVERASYRGILGINIGKNFDTPIERAVDDYLHCLRRVYPAASYIAINISSPNTQGLRQLQQADTLDILLARLREEQARLQVKHGRRVPLAVKIAPDLTDDELKAMAQVLIEQQIDAVIATNTTLSRDGVRDWADQAGGLSGAPLLARSTRVVAELARLLGGRIPIIAAGGILSAADAQQKFAAGAALVQVYSGLVYRGPRLVKEIVQNME